MSGRTEMGEPWGGEHAWGEAVWFPSGHVGAVMSVGEPRAGTGRQEEALEERRRAGLKLHTCELSVQRQYLKPQDG